MIYCITIDTYCAETFRYMEDGVRNSAEIEALMGTRFGGFESFDVDETTFCTVSNVGCVAI